jgi:hypothetical protein
LRSADGTLADVPKNVSVNIWGGLRLSSSLVFVENARALVYSDKTVSGQADLRCGFADQYDFAISLLLLGDDTFPAWHGEEVERDVFDRFNAR